MVKHILEEPYVTVNVDGSYEEAYQVCMSPQFQVIVTIEVSFGGFNRVVALQEYCDRQRQVRRPQTPSASPSFGAWRLLWRGAPPTADVC